jgi:hypothetical protein
MKAELIPFPHQYERVETMPIRQFLELARRVLRDCDQEEAARFLDGWHMDDSDTVTRIVRYDAPF